MKTHHNKYCGLIIFRRIPIFIYFMGIGQTQIFLRLMYANFCNITKSDIYKIAMFLQSTKIGIHENKLIHSIYMLKCYFLGILLAKKLNPY